jgi:hypothetical protein
MSTSAAKVLSLRLPESLHTRLQMTAQINGIDVTTAAIRAIEAYTSPCTYPQTRPWHELASDDDDDRRDARRDAMRDGL